MKRMFTTDGDGVAPANPKPNFAMACVQPSFSIQTTGPRGLFLVGSGWTDAGLDAYSLVSKINSYMAANFVYPTTTTTTTVPSTTSTVATIPLVEYYCLKPGGIGVNLVWKDSRSIKFGNPLYFTTPTARVIIMSLEEWSLKNQIEKNAFNMNEVAIKPIPEQGCSILNEVLVIATTTTVAAVTTNATTATTTTDVAKNSVTTTTLVAKSISSSTSSPKVATVSTTTSSSVVVKKECAPTSDFLYIYNYFEMGKVTNLGGKYDAGLYGNSFDWTRNCKVASISKVIIKDNYSIFESTSTNIDLSFNKTFSNCWQIARVSSFGQSDWSNQVCYTAPVIQTSSPTTISSPVISEPAFSRTVPKGAKGAQCFDGYRTKVRNIGACSGHFGRDYWLFKAFTVGYNYKYLPSISINSVGASSGKCVGVCFGVRSSVNGLPRNTYVSGYFRSDGTYVRPYTRSKP